MWRVVPKPERDARSVAATMDHSDVRGLATASHHFFAGRRRSRNGDHPRERFGSARGSHKTVEGSPHRFHASRCRFGIWRERVRLGVGPPGARKGQGECRSGLERHTAADVGLEAIGPSGFDQDAPDVFVAALGDGTLAAAGAARVLRGHEDGSEIAGPQLARQQQGIAPVGLHALLGGAAGEARRGDHLAAPAMLAQIPHPAVAAGTCFVCKERVFGVSCWRRSALHSSAGEGLTVPTKRAALRPVSATAIAMEVL